jgi:peptidoglycan hydrolase-like protein with peptidoglycan-binding domain
VSRPLPGRVSHHAPTWLAGARTLLSPHPCVGPAEDDRVVMRLPIVVRAASGCVIGALWLASAEAAAASDGSTQQIPDPAVNTSNVLVTMSCASATACTAVGSFITRAGTAVTLAERWNGARWSIQRTANPTGTTFSELVDVSGSSPTACTATGDYISRAGTGLPLTERWNGARWSIHATT